jgi:isopentenyl-diphosphate delta-isomerase
MLIEILDQFARPIGAMEQEKVHAQGLNHRRLLVLVYDNEKRICLVKYKENSSTFVYDLPVNTHILATSSREEMAMEVLKSNIGLKIQSLKTLFENFFWEEEKEFLYLYVVRCTQIPHISNPRIADILFLKKDELKFLTTKYPHLFSRQLIFLAKMGLTFLGINQPG